MSDPLRQLHIKVPEQLHRQLRIKAAAEDKTVQKLVIEILLERLTNERNLPEATKEDNNGS